MASNNTIGIERIEAMERDIRHLANSIVNGDFSRRHHPSYGVNKTSLRNDFWMLRGMVALYAVASGQHETIATVNTTKVKFNNPAVADRVKAAHNTVDSL